MIDAISIILPIAIFVVIVVVILIFSQKGKIKSPRLGFLNLKGAAGEQDLAEDRSAFASMFSVTEESTAEPPSCDVLFIYCDFEPDGRISDSAAGLRELIRDSGARVAVVASQNSVESCGPAAKETGYGHANLVLTFDRKGAVFSAFYSRLFALMMKGKSMPIAWVKLAPQIPGHEHADCPDGYCFLEAGQIAFKP